jgi:hypothetical protein
MKALKEFTVWVRTAHGTGIIKIKASSISNAYERLCISDKRRVLFVENEDGESLTANQILGYEEII